MNDEIEAIVDQVRAASEATRATITVSCDDDGNHKPRTVARFNEISDGRWLLEDLRMERTAPDDPIRHQSKRSAAANLLDGDIVVRPSESDNELRIRYSIECKLCKPAYKLDRTSERLWPILTKLQHAGLTTITLRGLAARL